MEIKDIIQGDETMNEEELRKKIGREEQLEKIDKYRILNTIAKKGKILFTGSSLMEQFPVAELSEDAGIDAVIYNRGVSGFTTDDMLQFMDEQIFGTEPSEIYINIGTNDIANPEHTFEENLQKTLANYENILTQIRTRLPQTRVRMMAYYPVNETDKIPEGGDLKAMFGNRNNRNLPIANEAVRKLAEKMGYEYIDVNEGLTDARGMLKAEYTVEGIHMYANGYRVVLQNLKPYLNLTAVK